MAFDLEGYQNMVAQKKEKKEKKEQAEAEAQAEAAKMANGPSLLDRIGDLASGAVETVKDVADATWTMEKNAQDVKTRGQQLEMAYTDASIQQSEASGNYQVQENAYKNFQQAGAATEGTVENVLRSPFRQASRSLIENYADRTDDSILGDAAKALQRTDANLEYFMTDEEKLTKARQIEASTGIPADSFLQDNTAYKQALDVYHYKQKIDVAGGNINDVWQEFPELQGVADMDKEGAAIALHNLDAVRSTHGIIDTFQKMLERGNVKLEYDNLQYKIMMGAADDNDRQRAEDLKKQIEEDRRTAPSFLEDPIAAIVGGVAESAPEMWQSTSESLREATAMAVIAAAASAAAGSVATPIGAAAGGTVGAAGGFVYGLGRSFLAQVARRELIAAAAGTGLRLGAFTGMARPEIGSRFAEYKDLKDENGNPLLTENQAAGWAMLGGSLNAGIELANFGVVTRALAGAPHARKVFGDIIEQTGSRMLTREKILNTLKDRTGDVLKITASEAGEEGLQSISDDMVHNGMEWSTGDTSNKIYGPGEILERAGKSTLQAIPGSLGFGLLGAAGGTVSSGFRQTAAMRHLAKFEATYGENARKTYTGTVMLEQLQQAIDKGNLKEKAPDVQKKILREQLKDTEYPNTYIDSEMAMQQEGGLENLKAVAKAAGISNDELQTAIEEKGQILVPTEQFLQAGTSPEFLQNVSFSPEADSMARMQRDAKTIIEDMQQRQQKSIDKQVELINTVLDQYFPLHEKSSAEEQAMRDMAAVAIYSDPANPARGWSAAMKERQERLQEHQAMAAVKPEIDELRKDIEHLEAIKGTMKSLNGVEMELTQGLTKEGFQVYRAIRDQLTNVDIDGGRTARAARLDAILFARHADIVADIISKKTGKKYTALDYMRERYGLSEGMNYNSGYQQSSMYRNPAPTFPEFVKNVMQGKSGKSYFDYRIDDCMIRVTSDDILHVQKGNHPLSNQEWTQLFQGMKHGIQEAVLSRQARRPRGESVALKIATPKKWYGVAAEFAKDGLVYVRTAFYSTDQNLDAWLEKNKREAGVRRYPGFPIRADNAGGNHAMTTSHSLSISSIQQALGIDKATTKYTSAEDESGYSQALGKGTHGSIAQMSNGQRIISLFESADESTFLHEMGHMFLLDLEDLAQIDEVSDKELHIVQEWASWHPDDYKLYENSPFAKEFRDRELAIVAAEQHGDTEQAEKLKRIWQQERFARAFEMYLHDGHAPAKGLKAVFRKFRSFLIHIYKAVIGDDVKPSLPVRRIMDRMIASEEEIEEMALDDRYRDVSKAGGEKLLDESEEETYERWKKEAEDEAKELLMKRLMADLTKEKEDEFQYRMDKERETFRKALQNEDVYLAEQAIKASGGDETIVLNWFPSVEAYREARDAAPPLETLLKEHMDAYAQELDRELTESHLSEEAVAKAMDSSKYRAKLESLTATCFAKKKGLLKKITRKTEQAMWSVEEKIMGLPDDIDLKMEKDSDLVKELMKAINRLRFSTRWSSKDYETIQQMIDAATKEEAKKAMDDVKQKMKDDKANEDAVFRANEGKMRVFRNLARKTIQAKPLHEACSPGYYTHEAKKWAKVVEQSIRSKNWDSAMMAQEKKAFYMALADESRKMKDHVNGLLARVKKMLQAKSVKLPRNERYWLRHIAYLLRLTKTDAKLDEGEEMPKLDEMFKSLKDSLDIQFMPSEIFEIERKGEDFRGYKDLNADQFEECVEAMTILYTTGRDKFKMKTIGGRTIDEIVQEIISDNEADARKIGVNRHRVQEDTGGMGWNDALAKIPFVGEGLARYGQEGLAAIIKPEEILNALGKKAHRYIYGIYERAAEKESRMVKQELTDLQKILSGYSHAERRHWKDKEYTLTTADGKELESKENILCMALNLGNETNRQRLVDGLGIAEKDVVKFVEEHMTAKDWQLVQDIWDHINTYWDDTVKVEEELDGAHLEKVGAVPFTVTVEEKGKKRTLEMKGGYYPLAYNPKKSSRAEEQDINEIVRQSMSGAMVLGTGRGFTKNRSENEIQRPLLLEFRVIPNHVQYVIHNIAFRLAARDVYRLVYHKDFENYVASTLGREYHTILKQWTTDVWQIVKDNNNQAANFLEKRLNWLRSNSVMAIMGYRIWPVVENISNIAPVMEKLGPYHTGQAIKSFYGNWEESTELLKRSAFMQDRINSLDRDIRSQPGLFDVDYRAFELVRNHAYDLMLYSDLALSAPLWVQSYRDAYSGNLAAIRKENAENQQSVLAAQKQVEQLKADIIDHSQKVSDIRMDMDRRHSADEQERAQAQQSPFAVHSDATMEQMTKEEAAKIKEIKKELFKAEQDLHDAMALPIYTDTEMLQEAERRSVMDADKAIRDTFGSGRTMDLSSLQRNKGAFLKLATTFYSFFNTQFNAILANYRHARFGAEPTFIKRWAPFAKSAIYRLIIMTLIGSAMKFALGLDGSDDKDKYRTVVNLQTGDSDWVEIPWDERFFKVYAQNVLTSAAGGFPFIRDVVNFAVSAIFDGSIYGRSASPFSVGERAVQEISKTIDLMARKSSHNLEVDAKEAKRLRNEAEKMKKKKGKARREYRKKLEEDAKYRQPVKHITNSEIARHGLNALSSLTAARTGITSTMTDAITGTMQYLNDSDNRYDADWKNIIWSVVFDKKPVERDIPKRPKKDESEKKKKKKKR